MARIKMSRKKMVIGAVLILLIGVLAAANILRSQGNSWFDSGDAIEVEEIRTVEKGTISATVVASGLAELDNDRDVYVESGVRVEEVLVEPFDHVSAGQQILVLDLESLNLQLEKELVNLQIQELTGLQSSGPGDPKELGDLESARLLAENDLHSALLSLDEAQAGLERTKTLYASGAASKVELETAQKKVDDASIACENARIRLANAVNSENTRRSIQDANTESSRLRVEELELQISQAEEAQYAPISGVVTSVNVRDGELGQGIEPSLVIGDFDSLQIRANVNEADKNSVRPGQKVVITSDAFEEGREIEGVVRSVAMTARDHETTTGKEKIFETVIRFEDVLSALDVLSPGQNVDCDIKTVSAEDALICSYDMILDDKDGQKYVFVVNEKDRTVRKQYVTLGIISELDAEITEGLSEGDVVVVNPPLNLKDGSKIKVVESATEG